ncbi:MAG: hypothetical protein IJP89_01860 [Synergistaceae bacterium]|nr:hypothetical protein [Synergistaceae bacterium]
MMNHDKDIWEKSLTSYNDVFAEIFNSLVFHGTGVVIDPDDLEDARAKSVYVPLSDESDSVREQERDVAKFWKKGKVILCLLGLENQTSPDRNMPLRIMGYEGADYRYQITQRDEALRTAKLKGDKDEARRIRATKFYPVITAVMYYGVDRRWDKFRSLRECLEIPEGLAGLVEDRHINVIELAWLDDEQMSRLKGDAWLVADALRQLRLTGEYKADSIHTVEHVEALLKLMQEFTGYHDLFREGVLKYEKAQIERRPVAMIDLAGGIYRGGFSEGRATTLNKVMNAMKDLGVSQEIIESVLKLCNAENDKPTQYPQFQQRGEEDL